MKAFANLKLSHKLPALIVALSLVTAIVTGGLSYFSAQSSLHDEAEQKLESVLENRVVAVQSWLNSIQNDLDTQSVNPTTLQALQSFSKAWRALDGDRTSYLQQQYITQNPNPTGKKDNLDYAADGSEYSRVHAAFHPYFRTFLYDRGYYDIFLFDASGNLVYTVYKELDYATNVVSGQWAGTDLGEAFRSARNNASTAQAVFFDFKPYAPSNNAPASFVAKALKDRNGNFIGVLAFQMPVDNLNALMNQAAGLGKTGETYLVGSDLLMRSNSRFSANSTILNRRVDTPATQAVIAGQQGLKITKSHEAKEVVTAYKPITFLGTQWGVIAEQSTKELFAPIAALRFQLLAQLVLWSVLLSAAGYFIARGITRPIGRVSQSMSDIAKGNYTVKVPFSKRGDEIGTMAKTVTSMRDGLAAAEAENLIAKYKVEALGRAQAVIEFEPDGTIIDANDNFLAVTGYEKSEIVGQHHAMFVSSEYATTQEYKAFWKKLGNGEFDGGEYKRFGKGGAEVWISATYNPILDKDGNVIKVVKFATNITEDKKKSAYYEGQLDAIGKAQAVIEFEPDGTIVNANENFCATVGYSLDEIVGQHHSLFVDNAYAATPEYKAFWQKLGSGQFDSGEYKRFGKGGTEIWIQASYNPIFDDNGNVFRVVKYATNITEDKKKNAYYEGQLNAIGKAQAVIEFEPDGTIVNANENFCATVGYKLDEIVGQHHALFVDNAYAATPEYKAFWQKLSGGQFDSGEYKRFGKGGTEIWIQASYNPIFDDNGNVFRVVKYATNITEDKQKNAYFEGQLEAISKAQAVIEFEPDGTIITANQNFLDVMGYSLEEIKGKKHAMFVEPAYAQSGDYKLFWDQLRAGQFQADAFTRYNKSGEEVRIRATYNPICDMNGNTFRVVKFATDITAIEAERERNAAERKAKSEEQQAVVEQLAAGLQSLSQGDLRVQLENPFAEEYEQLRADFNAAVAELRGAMESIILNAQGIRSNSDEVSQAADDLSKRTEHQAATLEETAGALDEITATVKQTAEGAMEANSVVRETRSSAEASGEVVRNAVDAMGQINKSSEQISQIIGVIDEIAFQTNLLALNAGVEAARAGEAGRGFAVVASEVRALAQRSSDAAKEIKELISASSAHVENGVDLVGRAGEALTEIVGRIAEVSNFVSNIATAAQEQATGIDEINAAVNQMDQVTQQNAAMVEESTAASHALSQESNQLMGLIGKFKTGDTDDAGTSNRSSSVSHQQKRAAEFAENHTARTGTDNGGWEDF